MSTENYIPSRFERILAYVTVTVMVVAVASYLATLIVGIANQDALVAGMWPFITWLAYVGLPFGFITLMLLLGVSTRRRSIANRAAQKTDSKKRSPRATPGSNRGNSSQRNTQRGTKK